jgi:hypothetical protein
MGLYLHFLTLFNDVVFNYITNYLTLWSCVPLKRPQVVQPLGSFPAFYGTRRFITDVRFEVFTAVTMKNGVFWVVTPCGSCKNHTA